MGLLEVLMTKKPKPTRGPTRRGRLQIQLRVLPAEALDPNLNNPHATQDPARRRRELLESLASALAKFAARRKGD
jgi:hypothetical protein